MKTKKADHRFTEDIAREYEMITLAYPDFEALQRTMVEGIDFSRGQEQPFRLLEIGTGDGFTTVKLARAMERAGDGAVLTTVDISAEMLAKARDLLEGALGEHHVQYRQMDALAFLQDEPEGHFDVVATSFTLHNFERTYRESVEQQIHRVLRPGGVYTNADKYAPSGQEQFDALALHIDHFFAAFLPQGKTELLRKWVIHNISDQSPRHVMFVDETVSRLEKLGFREVRIEQQTGLQAVLRARKG